MHKLFLLYLMNISVNHGGLQADLNGVGLGWGGAAPREIDFLLRNLFHPLEHGVVRQEKEWWLHLFVRAFCLQTRDSSQICCRRDSKKRAVVGLQLL